MKMAENPVMLSFQNNCESINSNCVEVVHDQTIEKITNGDITTTTTTATTTTDINNSENDPNMGKQEDDVEIIEKPSIDRSNISGNGDNDDNDNNNDDNDDNNKTTSTQEGTGINDDFLAVETKHQLQDDDDLLLDNIETDNDDGIVFKTDNVIVDCTDIEEKNEFSDDVGDGEIVEDDNDNNGEIDDDKVEETFDASPTNSVDDEEQNNTECLTKMQIMEEVHEGSSSIQPSSPGHAEERSNEEIPPLKAEETEENGFDEENNCVNDDDDDDNVEQSKPNDEIKEEKPDSEIVVKSENTSNSTMNEDNSNTNSSEESQNNNNINHNGNNNKRKCDANESPTKRLRLEIQENFISRDKILNEFIELADCNNVEQIQLQTEQVLAEIRTLNEMAKEKEREWNNIIHLKKMKEELLLRIQRRKQVILLTNDKTDNNSEIGGNCESQNQDILKNNHQSILKSNLTNQKRLEQHKTINKNRSILPKPLQQYAQVELNGDLKQQSQQQQQRSRPVLDVQSIIADYRQRHPETVPRRGRRIRSAQTVNKSSSSNIINFASLTLGSGSQVHHNIQGMESNNNNNDIGILLNAIDANRSENSRPSSAESSQNNELSFKDMLIQFAKLSQSERNELIQNAIKPPPPPYPEVTVHPVPTVAAPVSNSLLHGILTKSTSSKSNTKTSFSPTLARLLTAPERGNGPTPNLPNNLMHQSAANMSISEILSTSKARNEITITPVGAQYDNLIKNKNHMDEDEAEDSADRLVIDESNENDNRNRGGSSNIADNNSDVGDEVPQCQGCNQKSALFVCAGCGNQWYCSRDCQVSAWDEHSEVCSG